MMQLGFVHVAGAGMVRPLIMFDVEGTLVDCVQETLACWSRTFREHGFEFSIADLHRHSGRDPDDMIRALLPRVNAERLAKSLKKEQGERYRAEYLPKVQAFPGVRALFEALEANGYERVLVTSCAEDELAHYVKLTGIADLIGCIACGEEVRRQKPHPDLIDLALKKARHLPQGTFMVGDTPFDAQAAVAADVSAIGLLSGGFSKEALDEAGCKITYRDPAHLHQELFSWAESFNPVQPSP
jgi:phosphoglycolate phosphatase-like HAD superfamily hydrolase